MSTKPWIRSITDSFRSPIARVFLLTAYYLAVIAALLALYGKGDISSSSFVYQGF
jgi:hypothetical protein